MAPGADPNVVTLEVGADDVRPAKGRAPGSPLEIAADGDLMNQNRGRRGALPENLMVSSDPGTGKTLLRIHNPPFTNLTIFTATSF